MERERILITVKTYPTLSRKYGETVCTAGLREDGTWVRLYPVSFRRLDEEDQYRLFDWIDCRVIRNHADPRPETFRPADPTELRAADHLDTKDAWRERRRIVLGNAQAFDRLDDAIARATLTFAFGMSLRSVPADAMGFVGNTNLDPVGLIYARDILS